MEHVDMLDDQIAELVRQSQGAAPTEQVALLAEAVGLAWQPLQRLRMLMLLADAAGRAAHEATGSALAGQGMPQERPATWAEIAKAAGLTKDTAFRQFHGGQALSWAPSVRGVRQATRRGGADGGEP